MPPSKSQGLSRRDGPCAKASTPPILWTHGVSENFRKGKSHEHPDERRPRGPGRLQGLRPLGRRAAAHLRAGGRRAGGAAGASRT
eukprot:8656278-Alexandrium_andersonii.AAC.1